MADSAHHPVPDAKRPKKKKGNDSSDWLFLLFLLCVAPPIGAMLLVLKVISTLGQRGSVNDTQSKQPLGARTTAKGVSSPPSKTAPAPKFPSGKTMTTVGSILTAASAFITLATFADALLFLPSFPLFLSEMIVPLCFLGGSAGVLLCGLRRQKQARRFRKYLALIGKRKTISISALAEAMPARPAAVRRDLEDMLDIGIFPAGFLDYGEDKLVLSDAGLLDDPPAARPTPAAPAAEEDAILAEIRALNASISHKELSAQINRIEEITANIFAFQNTHPEKAPQLHSFLNYYLPTTLKILHAYARLEAQGVEGENITAAMSRIEDMMSKVVEGFEKQLDQLFQADAMDISSDVAVLERMLQKDGLSSGGGFQLGV